MLSSQKPLTSLRPSPFGIRENLRAADALGQRTAVPRWSPGNVARAPSSVGRVRERVRHRGHGDADIWAIMGGNALRVLAETFPER